MFIFVPRKFKVFRVKVISSDIFEPFNFMFFPQFNCLIVKIFFNFNICSFKALHQLARVSYQKFQNTDSFHVKNLYFNNFSFFILFTSGFLINFTPPIIFPWSSNRFNVKWSETFGYYFLFGTKKIKNFISFATVFPNFCYDDYSIKYK